MNVESFLKLADQFKLGSLTTESIHPLTLNLSDKVKNNLQDAIDALKAADVLALSKLESKLDEIEGLHVICQKTLQENKKIFLCGCGATGRLALTIEFLFRKMGRGDKVVAFMAGGDYALIKSVESFEDRMSYGARQLNELGFTEGDLLLAITEGGETSFVIGAALEATKISSNNPYFLYCNPDDQLMHIERSREVLEHSDIIKLNLTVGPMALSGSTRMQASTVQMYTVGMAILTNSQDPSSFKIKCLEKINFLKTLDYSILEPFISWEAEVYHADGIVTYRGDADLAISLLTDTTERSPTFSLRPFEQNFQEDYCLCYLAVADTHESQKAWQKILARNPRGLSWPNLDKAVDLEQIYAFDISENAILRRSTNVNHHLIDVFLEENDLIIATEQFSLRQPVDNCLFTTHLCLKLLMNTHSTLVMGKLDRYKSNMMTWVSPSNYKLIDRAARYVIELASQQEKKLNYQNVVEEIFKVREQKNVNQAIVVQVLENLL